MEKAHNTIILRFYWPGAGHPQVGKFFFKNDTLDVVDYIKAILH